MDETGVIFDLQRFSVHDGPGIRSLVFFKGCPLACTWCSNPESRHFEPELLFDPSKCIGCRQCVEACPNGAIQDGLKGLHYRRPLCQACGRCAEVCYAAARVITGRSLTADAVLAEILRDEPFFKNSGGGVTLGGGEPLTQPAFAARILRVCRERGLHTAVETCGHVPWRHFELVHRWTDLFLYDIKHLDNARHRAHTGGGVGLILSNLARLVATGAQVVVRTPVVPGFNDGPQELRDIAELIAGLGIEEIHLLPYHRLGLGKYRFLGEEYGFKGGDKVAEAQLQELGRSAAGAGLRIKVGG